MAIKQSKTGKTTVMMSSKSYARSLENRVKKKEKDCLKNQKSFFSSHHSVKATSA